MAASHFGTGALPNGRDIASRRRGAAEYDDASQEVGVLTELPGLLRELGGDPTEVLTRAALERGALDAIENRIPYALGGRLLNECVMNTG